MPIYDRPGSRPHNFPTGRVPEDFAPDGFRSLAQSDRPVQPRSPFSPQTEAEVAGLLERMVNLLANTNLTAAEPAFNQPHYWSQPIDQSVRYSLPAAATTLWTEVITYIPRDPVSARITQYGFNVRDTTYTYNGDILFRVCLNGNPVPGLENIAEQRGTIVLPASTFILAHSVYNDRVSFQVRRAVAGLAAVDIDFVLRGYNWKPLRQMSGPAIGTPA